MITGSFISDYSILSYTALQLGQHLLLLPESEIVAVIEIEELMPTADGTDQAIGMLRFEDRFWRIYNLDSDFRPTPDADGERRHCALFEDSGQACGLLCDASSKISRNAITTNPIAACMHTSDLLFTAVGLWNGQLVCLTNAQRLSALLTRSDQDVAHG